MIDKINERDRFVSELEINPDRFVVSAARAANPVILAAIVCTSGR